ncbi:Glycoside hydrolase, superfamily [Moorella glycerini]|uniref:4-alpha-glucanotransferase n=1 Tax=Neomoorella stamsii TaxID=1266720 RepID=A0A9X7J3Q3_9FIRM|nr:MULTISPECIES: 4-alpha-glucanotransferase [Moorella]PRR74438.1 4-alpha-glucanotransferase [Moorella stamsii]CEP67915.1 Glycoside hydrolase, superfamily [Moorella glycerini]
MKLENGKVWRSRACLAHLAASRARILLVNLEDLWLETAPQNIPGTVDTYPNWRRKARYTLEEFSQKPEVLQVLQYRKSVL